MTLARIMLSFCFLFLIANSALAQKEPGMLKEMFARSQQQNAEALKQYAWKSRNEVKKNGESKSTQVFMMQYDAMGNLQKSQISASAPPPMPRGPLMANIARKKKEDFLELMRGLSEQVKPYSHLSPEKMKAFLMNASITPDRAQGVIRIHGGNLLLAGDSMTIFLDPKTRKQRRVVIHTVYEKYPVEVVIDFNALPEGPTYMARTVVDYPREAVQLITENFDYQRERR
jgi:hypothetical protein